MIVVFAGRRSMEQESLERLLYVHFFVNWFDGAITELLNVKEGSKD